MLVEVYKMQEEKVSGKLRSVDIISDKSYKHAQSDLYSSEDAEGPYAPLFAAVTLAPVLWLNKPARDLKDHTLPVEKKWEDIINVFQQLTWQSREFAGEAQAVLSDFLAVFLDRLCNQDITLQAKLAELNGYSKACTARFSMDIT
ncbi:hypothetical protein EIP91_006177 [Steccherinum ochraceum]|uniref:Uncharacterized protein n=1 Tax=Steccherinum ochraceum TaxID=92696 RepID=A0A4R0R626_9APHY|nr:hypothetical protein EIP91_006177 [Steccherinum ochraceum]